MTIKNKMDSIAVESTRALCNDSLLLDGPNYHQSDTIEDLDSTIKKLNQEKSNLVRSEKAQQLENDGMIQVISESVGLVKAQSGNKWYRTDIINHTCQCADFEYRGTICKHQQAYSLAMSA